MADQVNPLGGLVPGMAQSLPLISAAPSPKPPPTRSTESKPKAKSEDSQDSGITKEKVEAAAESVESFIRQSPSDLRFMVDKDTGRFYLKIIDPATQETILQIPAEEILAMSKRLRDLSHPKDASGVLMDEQG